MPDDAKDFPVTPEQRQLMLDFVTERIEEIPSRITTSWIVDHAESNRVLPPSTPRPGPLNLDYTPYLKEPLNNLSPRSPVQRTIALKAAQGGWTMIAESAVCFYMDELPADQLFISATDGLLKRWAARRLEPAIDSYGIRHKIRSITKSGGKSRRSGDLTLSKEYGWCRLDMASARSSPSISATDKRILYRDEIDRAPPELTTGEGNWMEVSEARTNSWGDRKKIYDLSTPTTYELSLIWQAYLEGDRRLFMIPCPLCGKFQELRWGSAETQYGMKADMKAGKLERAFYVCDYCHDAFFNEDKHGFLIQGRWEASAEAENELIRSYHWSSMYAPIGMISWTALYQKFLKAIDDPARMRAFVNLILGLPYRAEGSRPKLKKVIELRGGYKEGTIPDGVLFLTMGMDVQRGSQKNVKEPARLELEICGHGIGYRTWSICYKVFEGPIDDPHDGSWADLDSFARDGGFLFKRKDGLEFSPVLIFIDSTDGVTADIVYQFAAGWHRTFPSKGFHSLVKRKTEGVDEMTGGEFKRYRYAKSGEDGFYEIATVFYKNIVYRTLEIQRRDIDPQRPGFCDFPIDYGEKYFRMLTAEERRDGGASFWCPTGRRNEALDCRVMNLCAAHVFLDTELAKQRELLQKKGLTKEQQKALTTKDILLGMAKAAANFKMRRAKNNG